MHQAASQPASRERCRGGKENKRKKSQGTLYPLHLSDYNTQPLLFLLLRVPFSLSRHPTPKIPPPAVFFIIFPTDLLSKISPLFPSRFASQGLLLLPRVKLLLFLFFLSHLLLQLLLLQLMPDCYSTRSRRHNDLPSAALKLKTYTQQRKNRKRKTEKGPS